MELRQLMHFLQVCRNKSFKRAAESLFISQQGLSSSIKRLEDELGAKLIERRPSGPVLLEDGIYLKNQAEKIAAILQECEERFALKREPAVQTTVACAGHVIGSFPDFFARLLAEKSAFRYRLVECSAAEGEKLLLSGEADLGILPAPFDVVKFSPVCKLFETPYAVVVGQGHPLAGGAPVLLSQLRHYPLLACPPDCELHGILYEACLSAGFEPNFVLQSSEEAGMFRMVQAVPNGVGLCAAYAAEQLGPSDLMVLPIQKQQEGLVQEVYLIEVQGNQRSAGIQNFISDAQRFFEEASEDGPTISPRRQKLVSGLG